MGKQFFTTLLLISFFTLSCSNITRWSQDPFAGKDESIKNGEEKPTPPVGPKPIPSDAVRVRAPDYVSFRELRTDRFNIVGQVLLKDYTFTMSLENLADFPGATFDEATGEFSWAPAKGTVVGEQLSTERVLKVRIIAEKPDEPILVNEKDIKIGIAREFTAPEILSVVKDEEFLREDDHMSIQVNVRDNDANPSDEATWPKLQFTNIKNERGLATFVYISQTRYESGVYRFSLYLDLDEAEITKDVELKSFVIHAISNFGVVGPEQTVSVKIFTSLTDAISTWNDTPEVQAGQTFEQQFIIADPKAEGVLSLTQFTSLPTGAEANCKKSGASVLVCRLKWITDISTTPKLYTAFAETEMRNSNSSDSERNSQTFNLRMRVTPPPTTTTLPVTTTTVLHGKRN